jgi:hypothetical protein
VGEGRVRGNADGLTSCQLLPALTPERSRALHRDAGPVENALKAELPGSFA